MSFVSEKIASLCQALDRAQGQLDPIFVTAMRSVLEDVLERSRMLERGLVPVVRIAGPIDTQHVAHVARMHLAGVRAATPEEVASMAAVALHHHMHHGDGICRAPKGARS